LKLEVPEIFCLYSKQSLANVWLCVIDIWNPVHLIYGGTRQFVLVHPRTYASGDMAV
jgi:hypothetical protein